ncbi:MAG: 4Fe-4S binding protein [Granulosicoccus sp.]|nr:4Fe-4S binding protein [Granulosicoccus sp.]
MSDEANDEANVVSLFKDRNEITDHQQLTHATSVVQYDSAGHCLVLGHAHGAATVDRIFNLIQDRQQDFKSVTVVIVDPEHEGVEKQLTDSRQAIFKVPELHLSGYLGAFKALVPAQQANTQADFDIAVSVTLASGAFDLVLDLAPQAAIGSALPPFGYQHVPALADIDSAASELSQLVGEFDKPKYFEYKSSICAHSRSEINGCSRCIDVCATDAIVSAGQGVSIDPFLCQGCGSCATVCPSGAMSYAYPRPSDAIDRSRHALAENSARVLLLHSEDHQSAVEKASLPQEVVPMLVEEISAFGADFYLSMLAARACRIVLIYDAPESDLNRQAVQQQIDLVQQLLEGLGIEEQLVWILSSTELSTGNTDCLRPDSFASSVLNNRVPQEFSTHNDKRQTMRLALDALCDQFKPQQDAVSLGDGSPFGRIEVDKQACTLCMACVTTCPAGAVLAGQGAPSLQFVEANCLQCGLCEQACPESAIKLDSRYVWDSVQARQVTPLNEEEPFHCLLCHKPFTTKSMIDNMSAKLGSHWMFQDEKAMRRLKLCGDCRVRDIFEQDNSGIDVHK